MTQSLQPYPHYRESGFLWLGKIPGHWKIKRGKSIFQCIDVRSSTGSEELLTVSSESGVVLRRTATVTMFKAESYVGYKLCWPGDLVINSLWAWARGLGVSKFHGIVSSAYGVYRLRPEYKGYERFIHELVRSLPFQWELQVRSKGVWTSRLQLTDNSFLGAPFPLPPPNEQFAIGCFLSYMDRRINRYIRAKKKLITLLNEQKQANIQQTVFHGLDPNIPLRRSGVHDLGDIPEHWFIVPLRYLGTKFGSGMTPRGGARIYQETGIPLIRSQNVHFDELRLDDVVHISEEIHSEMAGTHVKPGDVLLNITGASIGRVCAVPLGIGEVNVNQHVSIIRPRPEIMDAKFLVSYLSSPFIQSEIAMRANGAAREGLPLQDMKELNILVPPINEQKQIMTSLYKPLENVNTVIQGCQRSIEFMYEYRTRIIADVVTGKLDIRETANRLPDETEEQGSGVIEDELIQLDEQNDDSVMDSTNEEEDT